MHIRARLKRNYLRIKLLCYNFPYIVNEYSSIYYYVGFLILLIMKKCSTLAFFAFIQFIYIIAIAMCFYLFLYKGTQIFIVLFFLLLAGGINSYCLFKEIKIKI